MGTSRGLLGSWAFPARSCISGCGSTDSNPRRREVGASLSAPRGGHLLPRKRRSHAEANAFPFESGALSLDLSEFLSHVGDDRRVVARKELCVGVPFTHRAPFEAHRFARRPAVDNMDIMRTHPMVIIGAAVQENPFFVPPDQLLGHA